MPTYLPLGQYMQRVTSSWPCHMERQMPDVSRPLRRSRTNRRIAGVVAV